MTVAVRDQIWDLVAKSCAYLDHEEYSKYLGLVDDRYEYAIVNFSPDLRKDMVLLQLNRVDIENLFDNIHNHIRLPGRLFRQASMYGVEPVQDGLFVATTYLTVVHTDLDGASSVFCVGRYHDRLSVGDQSARLVSRRFHMETRDIGPGCHFPI
jgi:3-phenylpropionate/cinnamic acid dioxygenase small subunit